MVPASTGFNYWLNFWLPGRAITQPDKTPQHQTYNAYRLLRMFGLDSFLFARHYSGNHRCFLFLKVLRCFSSPRSPLLPMHSVIDIPTLLGIGCPIQRSPDLNLFSGSPELIAAYHVFHRLLTPRHPPFALSSLTLKNWRLPKPAYYMQLSKNRFKLQIPDYRFFNL